MKIQIYKKKKNWIHNNATYSVLSEKINLPFFPEYRFFYVTRPSFNKGNFYRDPDK